MSATELTAELLRTLPLPAVKSDGDKADRGTCLVIAGGRSVPGAGLLTGRAALRVGAGRLRLGAPKALAIALGLALPEARIVATASSRGEFGRGSGRRLAPFVTSGVSVVVGPGMLDAEVAQSLTLDLLDADGTAPFVVDAAALPGPDLHTRFAALAGGRVILTPHAGEMAALSGCSKEAVLADPLAVAREMAARVRSVVIMKGATSFVVSPDGSAWRHGGGVPGLGASGSGDVLAGVIGGLLARGAAPATAALWGVYLHAAAGARLSRQVGALGFFASDLHDVLPQALSAAEGA